MELVKYVQIGAQNVLIQIHVQLVLQEQEEACLLLQIVVVKKDTLTIILIQIIV